MEADAESSLRRALHIPDDESDVLDRLQSIYGIDEIDIQKTQRVKLFGPRSGISDARRVERALKLGLITKDYFIKDKSTRLNTTIDAK